VTFDPLPTTAVLGFVVVVLVFESEGFPLSVAARIGTTDSIASNALYIHLLIFMSDVPSRPGAVRLDVLDRDAPFENLLSTLQALNSSENGTQWDVTVGWNIFEGCADPHGWL
jgi:hypothetical protein